MRSGLFVDGAKRYQPIDLVKIMRVAVPARWRAEFPLERLPLLTGTEKSRKESAQAHHDPV